MEKECCYDDIINLPHHQSAVRPHMPLRDRAAQFSPFAALTGHEAAIAETARLTDEKIQMSEDRLEELNEKLRFLAELMPERPCVRVTCFVPDKKKAGGAYVARTGRVSRIDDAGRKLIFTDRTSAAIEDIVDIEIGGVTEEG